MYGDTWLNPASCPKKASCRLHLRLWDSDASATLLFIPSVCEMNLGDLSEASKVTVLQLHLTNRWKCTNQLHKNIYPISYFYSVTNHFSSFCFFFFLIICLASRVWRVPPGHKRKRQRVVPQSTGPRAPAAVDWCHWAAQGKSCTQYLGGKQKWKPFWCTEI